MFDSHPQVLEATDVDGSGGVLAAGKGEASKDDLPDGLYVGARVETIKRISATFNPGAVYTDIAEGTLGVVVGGDHTNVIVTFKKVVNGAELTVDRNTKPEKIKIASPKAASSSSSGGGFTAVAKAAAPEAKCAAAKKSAVPKQFAFITFDDDDEHKVEPCPKWDKQQARYSDDLKVKMLHGLLGFAHYNVVYNTPELNEKDLAVVKVDDTVEVWTLREFKPNTLVLSPETPEYRDRSWSQGRSALIRYDTTFLCHILINCVFHCWQFLHTILPTTSTHHPSLHIRHSY